MRVVATTRSMGVPGKNTSDIRSTNSRRVRPSDCNILAEVTIEIAGILVFRDSTAGATIFGLFLQHGGGGIDCPREIEGKRQVTNVKKEARIVVLFISYPFRDCLGS